MGRRVLVIGLDCAPPALVFERYAEVMPVVQALMSRGSWGPLRSCVPPITVPAWASMFSGRDAGELGLYGFRNRRVDDYGLQLVTSKDLQVPMLWEMLAAAGKRVASLFVPPGYPPRSLPGTHVSCFLTPGPELPHSHPPALSQELASAFGPYIVDVDISGEDRRQVIDALHEMTAQHFEIARYVWGKQQPDFMAMVEIGPDRLHHAFWQDIDPDHPGHDPLSPFSDAGRDYYALLDECIGALLRLTDEDTTVLLVSDHGARPLLGGVCVNEWLIEHGYLVLKAYPDRPTPLDQLEVDWAATRVWGEGGYYARIFLNVAGREPSGMVAPSEREALRDEIAQGLLGIPLSSPSRAVVPELQYRTCRGRPPDLCLFFGDLDQRSIGSVGHRALLIEGDDRRRDACNHDWEGIFVMAGAGAPARGPVRGYALEDVARTVLGLMDVACSDDLLGIDRSRP